MEEKIYIIHENEEWIIPLKKELDDLGQDYECWFIDEMQLDLDSAPPIGVFYNRMSASSHTRNHRYAPEMTASLLSWLEAHNRKIVNNRDALKLELSKVEQYTSLNACGIKTPKTIAVNSTSLLLDASVKLAKKPFILKPNRGGKGAGVQLFYTTNGLQNAIESDTLGESLDGIWLIQEFIPSHDGCITRVEYVGGELLYAVKVDASGGFELCPADSCNIDDAFCPADGTSTKFTVLEKYTNSDLDKYQEFLNTNGIGIGAIEYSQNKNGERYVYDVNTNTNYNNKAELKAGGSKQGMRAIAQYLSSELSKLKLSH